MSDEITICQQSALVDIDVLISEAFQRYDSEFLPKDDVGAAFLADRRTCGSDLACIAAIQARALETYGGKSPWVDLFAQSMMGRKACVDPAISASNSAPSSKFPPEFIHFREGRRDLFLVHESDTSLPI